jgi:S1-C subfamily serine protease
MFQRVAALAAILFLCWTPIPAEAAPRSALVKIYVVSNAPDYGNPWNMGGPKSGSGSGAIIDGRRILTNAHVISDHTFLQVRVNGEAKKYEAHVIAVSHETDLAVLGVEDPSFFDGIEPMSLGDLPRLHEPIVVCGFPTGGDTMSMTAGVVSRIEHQQYAHSLLRFLAIQVDAAINPGNSGGPAVSEDGKIVGVAMETLSRAKSIGYLIPTPVIRHFLEDIADGRHDGVPGLGVHVQAAESRALRDSLAMTPDMSGALVNRILPGASAEGQLEVGDVILRIDDYDIADDTTTEFRPQERTSYRLVVQSKQMDDVVRLRILRKGQVLEKPVRLTSRDGSGRLVKVERDKAPTYFIYGGLVFNPLTFNYIRCWGSEWYKNAPNEFLVYLYRNWQTREEQEIVVLNKVLPTEENIGYHNLSDETVVEVNGKRFTSMKHLVEMLERQDSGYVDILTAKGRHIILDRQSIRGANGSIMARYKIETDRSGDLL